MQLWDTKTGGHIQRLTGHGDWVTSVAFSSNGSVLASGGADGTVLLWRMITD